MGVPAFFRWLSRKYPSVIIECNENKTVDDEGRNHYEDATLPNPNGIEFDNLYLDMNGIIHPCTHPEDKPPPKNEDEMMVAIFECIDRLFCIVRPRKLLYMAIDGVAPRAKMNQQRSRRFRAAKESVEKRLEMERVREELLARGCVLPPEKPKEEHFDSNCITPGTPFMQRLSECLSYYIHERMNNNPAWKSIKVILSDANVPGEGEHKIMDYIRKQRAQPDHDPNTQHVLCGADADLIMLGLATHEPNFTIIREEFLPNKPRPCDMCGQFGHELDKCEGLNGPTGGADFKPDVPVGQEVKFIFVRLSVLREYLQRTLQMPGLPFKYEFERALDDWVFMCFFVGNDFLPHLPSLEIREGAVDRLVELYKKCVYKTGGYITDSGEVNLDRVQLILNDLGYAEDQIFKDRQKREKQFQAREKAKKRREGDISAFNNTQFAATALGRGNQPGKITNYKQEAANVRNIGAGRAGLDALMRPNEAQQQQQQGRGQKRTAAQAGLQDDESDDEQKHDEVRLWEDGFKDRYYESKFDVGPENLNFRYSVALQYVRGLSWVLKYYYQGCASWNWYFPYHYAPFASDFKNIAGLSTQFEKGSKPFNPLEQLMGVFPAASSSHVPAPWAKLMSDPKSPIIDFYPEDFKIDLNGKKFAWQGVALLPFVDERRLFKALKPYYPLLTDAEIKRNKCGDSRLYVASGNEHYNKVKVQYTSKISINVEVPICFQGMGGLMLSADENVPLTNTLRSPIKGLVDICQNTVITVRYRDPKYDSDYIFPAIRLENAVDPPCVLGPESREEGYRPQIGFTRNVPQASLGQAGHRMLNSYSGGGGGGNNRGQNYAQIAPPKQYNDRYNSNQQRGGNNYQNHQGGSGNNYQQYGNRGNNYQQQGNRYGGGGSGGGGYNNQQRYGGGGGNNNYNNKNNQGGGGYNNNNRGQGGYNSNNNYRRY